MNDQNSNNAAQNSSGVGTESERQSQGLVWHEVKDDDESTLPPLDKPVLLIYLSDYDNGQVIQLGGRTLGEDIDDDTYGWSWAMLDTHWFARNWEPKLYGFEADDDYRVTHWADIPWPTRNATVERSEPQP